MTRHAREKNRGRPGFQQVPTQLRKTKRGHVGLVEAGGKKQFMPLRTRCYCHTLCHVAVVAIEKNDGSYSPFQSHQDQVARQLVLGVLDSQLAETAVEDAMPEVQFAYDGDVFRLLAQQEQGFSISEVSWECLLATQSYQLHKDYLGLKGCASR